MNDKHYKAALILLTLPLSFGGGTTAGAAAGKPFGDTDGNNFLSLKGSATGTRGFKAGDVGSAQVLTTSQMAWCTRLERLFRRSARSIRTASARKQ
jgi:hypothetical protein